MERVDGELKARAAFEKYIEDLKASLPADASFVQMEQASLRHPPQMMQASLEGMANFKDFSRSEEAIL